MPYPNEYACRLLPKKDIITCRSMDRESATYGKKYRAIICQFRNVKLGASKWYIQSLRFPAEDWTEAQARTICSRYEGDFEPLAKPEETRKMELPAGQFVRKRDIVRTLNPEGLFIRQYEKGSCVPYRKYPCREDKGRWEGIEERSKFSLPENKEKLIKAVAYVFEPGEKLTDFIPPHHYYNNLDVSKSAIRHTLGVLQGARGGYARLSNEGYACVWLHIAKHARDCEIEFTDPKSEWGISEAQVDRLKWWEKE